VAISTTSGALLPGLPPIPGLSGLPGLGALQDALDASSSATSTLTSGPITTGTVTIQAPAGVSMSSAPPPWLLLAGIALAVYLLWR